ncbi:MAG: ribose 5-phosphate isomerase B [Oscillospiraceae bacterium]|nr:ribose 5-phosphate isomerase B [Oscillospiraceae bacterium]
MKIAFGSDHAGYDYRQMLMEHAKELGHEVIDMGPFSKESCDYPVYGKAVAEAVSKGEAERGILICGTGFGISLAANRMKGIRCVNASEEYTVKLSRHHNNSNMISIGARVVGTEKAISLMDTFLTEEFDGERHQRRIDLVDTL